MRFLFLIAFGLILAITGIRAVMTGKFSYRGTKAVPEDDGDFWIPVIAFIVLGIALVAGSIWQLISN
jgi:hypothetical protein